MNKYFIFNVTYALMILSIAGADPGIYKPVHFHSIKKCKCFIEIAYIIHDGHSIHLPSIKT